MWAQTAAAQETTQSAGQNGTTPGPAQRESSGEDFDRTPENEPQPISVARPKFQLTRWLEDWRPLKSGAVAADPFDPLKYIPLAPDGLAHLTLSGQWREDPVAFDASLFDPHGDALLLHRIYVGADLHVGQTRLFLQLANTVAVGQSGLPGPTDEDRLDVQQLFADVRVALGDGAQAIARVGRQELAFDPTQRFVGVREGPNNRQAFDAARVNFAAGNFYVLAFASRPVQYRPGTFDDPRNKDVAFSGVYATRSKSRQTQALYVYRYVNDAARFGGLEGRERRWAFGSRLAGRWRSLDYDVEGMLQSGRFADQPIRAWGVGALGGYTVASLPWFPRIGMQVDLASGDRNRADGRLGTFNPLFFKAVYFLEAPISSFANVRHLKPSLSFRPSAEDTVSVSYGDFSRMRAGDVVYATPLVARPQTASMVGKQIGSYLQLVASHSFGIHLSLSLEADRFRRSDALRAVGGNNVDYGKVTANFLF